MYQCSEDELKIQSPFSGLSRYFLSSLCVFGSILLIIFTSYDWLAAFLILAICYLVVNKEPVECIFNKNDQKVTVTHQNLINKYVSVKPLSEVRSCSVKLFTENSSEGPASYRLYIEFSNNKKLPFQSNNNILLENIEKAAKGFVNLK